VREVANCLANSATNACGHARRLGPVEAWWSRRVTGSRREARPLHHLLFGRWSPSPVRFATGEDLARLGIERGYDSGDDG
jgi:hypothetical protein